MPFSGVEGKDRPSNNAVGGWIGVESWLFDLENRGVGEDDVELLFSAVSSPTPNLLTPCERENTQIYCQFHLVNGEECQEAWLIRFQSRLAVVGHHYRSA